MSMAKGLDRHRVQQNMAYLVKTILPLLLFWQVHCCNSLLVYGRHRAVHQSCDIEDSTHGNNKLDDSNFEVNF